MQVKVRSMSPYSSAEASVDSVRSVGGDSRLSVVKTASKSLVPQSSATKSSVPQTLSHEQGEKTAGKAMFYFEALHNMFIKLFNGSIVRTMCNKKWQRLLSML